MVFLIFLQLFLAAEQPKSQQTQKHAPGLRAVAWMAGCWEDRRNDRIVREEWKMQGGKEMIGRSVTTSGDSTLGIERLRISEGNKGILTFFQGSDSTTVAYTLVRATDNTVVFAHRGTTFPQRIMYILEDKEHLTSRLEGFFQGRDYALAFTMKKVPCSPPSGKQRR